ncbi:MAG: MBL fold metallo-hydrolase [bacterium]
MTRKAWQIILADLLIASVLLIGFVWQKEQVAPVLRLVDSANQWRVVFLDVGQGDAVYMRTPDNLDVLVDGGPDDMISKKISQYLPFGDQKIDLLILTHPHADHVTGLVELINKYQIERIMMTGVLHMAPDYLAFLAAVNKQKIPVTIINGTSSNMFGKYLQLDILWPKASFAGERLDNLNNSSIVTKWTYVSSTLLMTGDFEQEEKLINDNVMAQVYKVGHHGSSNANSKDFLNLVKPQIAVILVGKNNTYGHPHYRTLYYLQQLGTKIYRTDELGDVVLVGNVKGFEVVNLVN